MSADVRLVYSPARDALRDQLAVHAPEPPEWFEASVEPPPLNNPGRLEQWKKRRAIAKTVQWPWHYADLVLAERDVVRGER